MRGERVYVFIVVVMSTFDGENDTRTTREGVVSRLAFEVHVDMLLDADANRPRETFLTRYR